MLLSRDGKPIYNRGPHGVWNIAGGPQKLINFILKFHHYLPKENEERKLCSEAEDPSDLLSTRRFVIVLT